MKPIKLVNDTIDKSDINELIKWLDQEETPKLTKGDLTIQFEQKFSTYLNQKYSVYVNSGSSAILLLLSALKFNNKLKNDKIVIPGLSWATDLSSPILLGLNPILCDVNIIDLSIDVNHLEQIFKTENPSVLLLVSVLGLVPNMNAIVNLCKQYDVILLEDACESLGSEYYNQKLGTFGLASTFSFYFGHHISTIEGGMISTNDEELYQTLIAMRSHGWGRDLPKEINQTLQKQYNISEFKNLYTFYYPGFNLRSTDLQAFIGLKQLNKLDDYINKRNKNFEIYNSKLSKYNQICFMSNDNHFISNMAYPIINDNRNVIVEELVKNHVEVRPLIAGDMSIQPMFIDRYKPIKLPMCNKIEKYGFYLPNHPQLTLDEINLITNIIITNS